ncbi:hypothetical protein [Fortiea contorta]|nr:hypothetical protein [Fortiea contorta]
MQIQWRDFGIAGDLASDRHFGIRLQISWRSHSWGWLNLTMQQRDSG